MTVPEAGPAHRPGAGTRAGSVWWVRRDLRLHDNPALLAAAVDGPVTALFVLDDALWRPAGAPRRAWLAASLRALDAALAERGTRLVIRRGDPREVVPQVAAEVAAASAGDVGGRRRFAPVHVAADLGPYGRRRDAAVAALLDSGEAGPGDRAGTTPWRHDRVAPMPGPDDRAEPFAASGDGVEGSPGLETGSPYVVTPGADERAEPFAAPGEGSPGLVVTGSPYAVTPGRVRTGAGTPFQVFTPFARAWAAHGWRRPAGPPDDVRWAPPLTGDGPPAADGPDGGATFLTDAGWTGVGEEAARRRWAAFRDGPLRDYAAGRDRPDLAATSRLSPHLRWGEIHPRTLLADLADVEATWERDGLPADPALFPAPSAGRPTPSRLPTAVLRTELAWREFYADVLARAPGSARDDLRPALAGIRHDTGPVAEQRFTAWCHGRTGYPFVDAGMRQLLATGWMHNRVRMVVASFLVKDLHLPWQRGARWFMARLVDADLASNAHGWQWAAGTGTDAAPYVRVFNPVTQGLRFDPDGAYVRRWVPELRGLAGPAAHQPWLALPAPPAGYPARIVDHAEERAEALRRLAEVTGRASG